MKQYNKFKNYIQKNVVPEAGSVINELESLRTCLRTLLQSAVELREYCVDNGYLDIDDESEGYNELCISIEDAEKLLK